MIYLKLFWTFFKIGISTFGGGYAMLPLIQAEVARHGWMKNAELINFIAVSESTPGPFAINISTFVGAQTGGLFGAFCATFGVVLPSFVIILIVAKCFLRFKNSKIVAGCMSGLKPGVIGLIATAVLSVGQTVFFPNGLQMQGLLTPAFMVSVGIFVVMTALLFKKVHPILILGLSAVVGIAAGYILHLPLS